MADGPLHSRRCGLEGLGHLGVEHLGNGVDHIHIIHSDDDGLPQILVALDVGRDANLVDDVCDHALNAGLVHPAGRGGPEALPSPDLLHAFHQSGHIAGLQHQVANPQIGRGSGDIIRYESRCSQRCRPAFHSGNGFQHADSILLAQHQVQHQDIGFSISNQADGLFPVGGGSHNLEAVRALQCRCQPCAELFRTIRNQYGG